ncbi:MAG: hypothetical protein VX317_02940 [Verrucomicrobiota bacterium]|nr:hypothetical protein [Verrucomicrobiota bacterium]
MTTRFLASPSSPISPRTTLLTNESAPFETTPCRRSLHRFLVITLQA